MYVPFLSHWVFTIFTEDPSPAQFPHPCLSLPRSWSFCDGKLFVAITFSKALVHFLEQFAFFCQLKLLESCVNNETARLAVVDDMFHCTLLVVGWLSWLTHLT